MTGSPGTKEPVALPARYDVYWRQAFDDRVGQLLRPGMQILDIGSGRKPTLPSGQRPDVDRYAGLDLSRDELASAPHGAYDETVAADITRDLPHLHDRFDLAVSWQVLEHIRPMEQASKNIHRYLRPGGTLVAFLSGTFSVYAILNKLLPNQLGEALVTRVMGRRREVNPVFPAHYHRCYASALRKVFAEWSKADIVPFYRAAGYFSFSPTLARVYLQYENAIAARDVANLATHYLVVATK